ncbi:hypothetical protein GQ600_297 [Phytophthora cactorum]|nr:hypothetical protein GQ600_297 [Phytophthora cactorum]
MKANIATFIENAVDRTKSATRKDNATLISWPCPHLSIIVRVAGTTILCACAARNALHEATCMQSHITGRPIQRTGSVSHDSNWQRL